MKSDADWAEMVRSGMVECSWCNGYGSSLKEEAERCTRCGGSGLVSIATASTQPVRTEPAPLSSQAKGCGPHGGAQIP